MSGSGSIVGSNGGQATFSFDVSPKGKKGNKSVGSVSYSDPAANINFTTSKKVSLTISSNHATLTGTVKQGKTRITFTINVTDNGLNAACPDQFTINLSTGYSAGGNLTSGDVNIHN